MQHILATHDEDGEACRQKALSRGHDMGFYVPQPETGFPMSLCLYPSCEAAIVLEPRGLVYRDDTASPCSGIPELDDWERA